MIVVRSGILCVIMFAIGFGFLVPVSSLVGDIADVVGLASGMVFFGFLDDE